MRTAMQDSSIRAYRDLLVQTLKTQSDRIETIVNHRYKFGTKDMSLREIQKAYRFVYGDIDLSTVAARVNGLVAAKRLERMEETRKCSITGIHIHPLKPAEKLQ